MEKQFLPKPLKKYQSLAYKNFSWIDIVVLFCFFMIVILIWITFPINYYFKVAASAIVLLVAFVTVLPTSNGVKIYQKFFYFLLFISSKNKYNSKESNLLFPYVSIQEGLLKLKTGSYVKIIELYGFDLFLLQEAEQKQRIISFQNFILKNNSSFRIYKSNLPIDLKDQKEYLKKIQEKWVNNKKISKISKISEDILNHLINQKTHIQDRYFLFIYGASKNDLQEKYKILKLSLERAYLNPEEIWEKNKIINVINSLYLTNLKVKNNNIYLEDKFNFNPTFIKANEKYMKIFAVYGLPKEAYVGWMASLSNINNVDWMIDIKNYPKDKAKKKLDKVIASLEIRSIKKASEEAQKNTYLEAMYELNHKLNFEGETIKSINIFVVVKAKSKKELDLSSKALKNQALSSNIYLNPMMNLQKDMFKEMVPTLSKELRITPSLEVPSMSIAYGFPFLNEDHKDKNGMYLGYSSSGRNIFFDPTLRNSKRVNSNMYIFGSSGKGKSTISKKLMKDLFLAGHRIVAIDPEREYDILCKNLDGTWINFGTDRSAKEKNYIINPMQFLKNESDQRELLSSHIQFLEQFFRTLIPELNLREISILKKYIILAYADKKITDANSYLNFKTERYPLISDVAKLIQKDLKKEKDQIQKDIMMNLFIYFETFLDPKSPESKLWNNHTNFNLYDSQFIVNDIQSLTESGNKRLINAQMFILLKMVNNFMVENKIKKNKYNQNKFLVLVIDEAHLLVDSKAPFATRFMFEVVKRGRKYNAMTIITTQSVRDFLGKNSDLSDLTSGIINNSQYAFILGMKSGDIQDLDDSMQSSGGLTEHEKETLSISEQGTCLFLIGNKNRKIMKIDVAKQELDIWEKIQGLQNV